MREEKKRSQSEGEVRTIFPGIIGYINGQCAQGHRLLRRAENRKSRELEYDTSFPSTSTTTSSTAATTNTTITMERFKADDFAYDFAVEKEETVSLVGASDDDATAKKTATDDSNIEIVKAPEAEGTEKSTTDGYKLYEEKEEPKKEITKETEDDDGYKYEPPKGYRGGESFVSDDSAEGVTINAIAFLGAVCCCLTVGLVIVGGILICYEQYKDSESFLLVGTILIVLAVGACLCGCCSLCLGVATDGFDLGPGANGLSKGNQNHKEVKVRLRRLNDRYEKGCLNAENSLRQVRMDVVGQLKEVCQCIDVVDVSFHFFNDIRLIFPFSFFRSKKRPKRKPKTSKKRRKRSETSWKRESKKILKPECQSRKFAKSIDRLLSLLYSMEI